MTLHNSRARRESADAATPTPATDLLTDPQAAAFLQVEPRTLRLWRKRGLPHIRITAKTLRYRRSDLDKWISQRRVTIGG